MTNFAALWEKILVQAEPRAVERARSVLEVIAAADLDVELHVDIFIDQDDPWLPSVWLTPTGKDHFMVIKLCGNHRLLLDIAFGIDAEIHLNGEPEPIAEFFNVPFPKNGREQMMALVGSWVDSLWARNFGTGIEIIDEHHC